MGFFKNINANMDFEALERYIKTKGWRIDREMPIIKDENREYVEKYIYIGEGM